jgi:hypothetical protein
MRILKALALGALATLALFGLSAVAADAGQTFLSRALFWQNTLLQALVPMNNIGTTEHPVYEGSPLNVVAYFLSFPLGFVAYSSAAFVWLRPRVEP